MNNGFDLEDRERTLDGIEEELAAAIGAQIAARRRRNRNRTLAAACSVILLGSVAIGLVGGLPGGGSNPVTPAAATVFKRAADAAERFEPRNLKAGEYLYSDRVLFERKVARNGINGSFYRYEFRQDQERWIANDYSGFELGGIPRGPSFPTDEDRAGWIAAGRPELHSSLAAPSEPSNRVTRPAGYFRSTDAVQTYLDPQGTLSDKVLAAYGLSTGRLRELAGRQAKFDRYVLSHVRRVTAQLYGRVYSAQRAEVATEDAVFSLALELVAQSDRAQTLKLRGALLRLCARVSAAQVQLPVKDPLGRTGIAVSESNGGPRVIFDPSTFVVLSSSSQKRVGPGGQAVDPVSYANAFVHGIVAGAWKRPDGTTAGSASDN